MYMILIGAILGIIILSAKLARLDPASHGASKTQ
jgi:hypothetical protein